MLPMQDAARRRGVKMDDLRARQFQVRDFDDFDLIVAMDAQNQVDIERQRPKGNKTAVRLFTDYAAQSGFDAVPDPYYTRDFDGALDLIESCARGLVQELT